jgi:hypothetical protein
MRGNVEAIITFKWPCSLTQEQLNALVHQDAYEEFKVILKRQIHNGIEEIIQDLITSDQYEVDIVERDPA